VRRADTVSKCARDYYDLRKNLLTRQHEVKLNNYATKMRWKEEQHRAKMHLLQLQMHHYATHAPQNIAAVSNHTDYSNSSTMYGNFHQL
jgi:hypothetical protein